MREILFRAQTRKKGEKVWMDGTPVDGNWVYGGLSVHGTHVAAHSLICEANTCKKIPVYADTVGQFTGLTDKNGIKIFEGDIVRYSNSNVLVVRWFDCEWALYNNKKAERRMSKGCSDWYEVIGNIHDNPELLKEGQIDD